MSVPVKSESRVARARNFATDLAGKIASQQVATVVSAAVAGGGLFVTDHPIISTVVFGTGAGLTAASATYAWVSRRDKVIYEHSKDLYRKVDIAMAKLRRFARQFENQIEEINADRRKHLPPTETELEVLLNLKRDLLKKVCETAAEIFDLRKPQHAPFAANIKGIKPLFDEKKGTKVPKYLPQTRSNPSPKALFYDIWLNKNPIAVGDNAIYRRILAPEQDGYFTPPEEYFMNGNVPAYVAELNAKGEKCLEPNLGIISELFQSCFVSPISEQVSEKIASSEWYQTRGLYVPGLLCIDSLSKGAFNDTPGEERDLDLDYMRQLTSIAFSAFKLVESAYQYGASPTRHDTAATPTVPGKPKGTSGRRKSG